MAVGIDRDGDWSLPDTSQRPFRAEGRSVRFSIPSGELRVGDDAIATDVVFPVLHGPKGEDGSMQGVFEISDLAYGMQDESADGGASQVRIGFDEALEFLNDERDEDIVRAGVALSVLDEDAAHDEVLFFHQLLQEYFAGRKLGVTPNPERVRVPWKKGAVQ